MIKLTEEELSEIFDRWYGEHGSEDNREGAEDTFIQYLEEIRSE